MVGLTSVPHWQGPSTPKWLIRGPRVAVTHGATSSARARADPRGPSASERVKGARDSVVRWAAQSRFESGPEVWFQGRLGGLLLFFYFLFSFSLFPN